MLTLRTNYYICRDCESVFCKLPAYCSICSKILINDLFLNLIKSSYEYATYPADWNFVNLLSLYNDFKFNKIIYVKELKNKSNFRLEDYLNFKNDVLEYIKMTSRKDRVSKQSLSNVINLKEGHNNEKDEQLPVNKEIKMILLFYKSRSGNLVLADMDKQNLFNEVKFILK